MKGFTPCLWFDGKAEEAARYYTSIFKDSKITAITRYGKAAAKASGQPEGAVMTVEFEISGQPFLALNGGPQFQFTPAISLMAHCDTQAEIDRVWERLSEGGQPLECGWLTDRFGVSWQVVPTVLTQVLRDKDPAKIERVMAAMVQMTKLDVAALVRAYEQPSQGGELRPSDQRSEHRGSDRPPARPPRRTGRDRLDA
jgi:predicted 3-demethylubiquinone-9 3-methyltransferase (glyoxalase superfamily)